MRLALITPAIAALALAACGGGDDNSVAMESEEGLTARQLEGANAAMVKPQPGLYRAEVRLLDVDIPGLPQEQVAAMKGMFSDQSNTATQYCLTPEQAEKGFEELAKSSQNSDCKVQKFNADARGAIDASMTCRNGDGEAQMELTGRGTPTTLTLTMEMSQEATAVGPASMTMRINQERVGECPAG